MKRMNLVFLVLITQLGFQTSGAAVPTQFEIDRTQEIVKTIEDSTENITAELNEATVLCLVGDYGASSLKISIPDIARYTNLDHTSPGAPGPCINAGRCNRNNGTDTRLPLFQDAQKPTENVSLRVLKEEVTVVNPVSKTCSHTYRERLSSIIRGVPFFHQVEMRLAPIDKDICDQLVEKAAAK